MDQPRQLVGQVENINGHELILVRPGGFQWEQHAEQCRPASPQEAQCLTPIQAVRVITGRLETGDP